MRVHEIEVLCGERSFEKSPKVAALLSFVVLKAADRDQEAHLILRLGPLPYLSVLAFYWLYINLKSYLVY